MSVATPDISQTQRERLVLLELCEFFSGELCQGDNEAQLSVNPAAASRDLSSYQGIAPDTLDYDAPTSYHRPSAIVKPIFEFSGERVLEWLDLPRFHGQFRGS